MSLQAVLFDMDGVITDTAAAHAAAWQQLFDEYLSAREAAGRGEFTRFDTDRDYREHVDGKPRYDGVRSFLASRGIELPLGSENDDPGQETICGLGNRKNRYFNAWLEQHRVEPFPGTLALIKKLHRAGLKAAVFSSSRNAEAVLRSAGVLGLLDAKVDGRDLAQLGLPGKPDPAIIARAADLLGVRHDRAAVVEDAISGVEAGARGGFAPIIGVDRTGHGKDLEAAGAHLVVADLAEIDFEPARGLHVKRIAELPSAWGRERELLDSMAGKRPVVFVDYDGTLSHIAERPSQAILSESMREALAAVAERMPVAVISGRDLDDVCKLVRMDGLFYAGSHGFEMAGPGGWHEIVERGKEFLPALERAERALENALSSIDGAWLERKSFSMAVHYRQVPQARAGDVRKVVDEAIRGFPSLRASPGKKVYDIKPATDWHKGRAVLSLLKKLAADDSDECVAVYVGDDVTDEDALRVVSDGGIGLIVRTGDDGDARATAARYALDGPDDVQRFLEWLVKQGEREKPS